MNPEDTDETRDPEPKIYAPFLSALENDHPEIAPRLVGIGDRPYEIDDRKRVVTARFETEAGTPFSGSYITEGATSFQDARTFLGVMLKKFRAATEGDEKVLKESPATVPGPLDRPAGAVAPDRGDTLEDGTPRYEPEPAPGENPPEKPTDAGGAAEGEYTPPPGSPEDTSAAHAREDESWDDPTKTEQ